MKKREKINYRKRISLTNLQKSFILKYAESIIDSRTDINGKRIKIEKEIEDLLRMKTVHLL